MKTRTQLLVLAVLVLLAVCAVLRRTPEQLACAADTFARAVTLAQNLKRQGRGQALLRCPVDPAVGWLR